MKKLLWILVILLLPCAALAEGEFVLTAAVSAEESALYTLPAAEADVLLPMEAGEQMVVTALGTVWCEAVYGEVAGYVPLADIAFAVMGGEPTRLAQVDVSPTNLLHGRMSLREQASTKSKALCRLAKGCLVLITGEDNGMYQLAIPGFIGYGQKKNINPVVEPAEFRLAWVDNDDPVHLRLDSRYGENWVVMKLEPGAPVQFIKNPNGWAQVEVAGHRGRIVGQYLSFDPPETE